MPLNTEIKRVMVIGSGPIVIGQAAEFDYAGTQAVTALKEDNLEIVLVNSNPATIMTDKTMADSVYLEPLTLETVKRIIVKEKPDSILSGLGGQTGLNLCMQLAKEGFLKEHNVRLLGASPETIDKAEDRLLFKEAMESINQPVIPSEVVTDVSAALDFAQRIGYPVIVRPAFTLGGSGGGIADDPAELTAIAENGIALSPIHQILVERSIAGWKEIEFEVIRDSAGNVITVCSMENFDPVGIHTGDSIVVAPAVTLADKEYQMLRDAALTIICTLGIEGGCNCQFALNPDSFEYAVIEVNPRVSRSSALASKATGYPIAKVATKIALGYHLDEIKNTVTGKTYAAFEPALDYVAVKFPKWPFDKFVYAKRTLGTQMKATGEVMAISDTFESALMKAVRGAEISLDTLNHKHIGTLDGAALEKLIGEQTDERLFAIFESLKRGVAPEVIHRQTKIDMWFLSKLMKLVRYELELAACKKVPADNYIGSSLYMTGKKLGYTDAAIERLSGLKIKEPAQPYYRMVDTCAGEFAAETPYFYSVFDDAVSGISNEAAEHIRHHNTKKRIIVLGSGPIRIGQGIEFDYAGVHCVRALQKAGYEVIIINNNPETVSTDFDTGDRLYFEPLTPEDVLHIINLEQPEGVFASFGGGTAIKLTPFLAKHNIPIIGTSADTIDMAEDRERFDGLLEKLHVKRPQGETVFTADEALAAAERIGYPVLMRPSYVLGGQNMIIAYTRTDIIEYMEIILRTKQDNPVLIDKYISGTEVEVDAICDGTDILIPGIMEHVERTGIHSGDSIAVYPAPHIDDNLRGRLYDISLKLCTGLSAVGLVNIQYIIAPDDIYVIEVNPRASRTVPYISKVTGVPMCDLAVQVSLGKKLKNLGCGTGVYKMSPYTAVKVPVFSFEKLTDVDTHLGPEMKSTGEVLGIGKNLEEALYKGLAASGYTMQKTGGVFISVRSSDKKEMIPIAKKYDEMGFTLYATEGNADTLRKAGMQVTVVEKIHASNPASENVMTLIKLKRLAYIISTSAHGRDPARDSVKIRRAAVLHGILCFTSLDTANAMASCLQSAYSQRNTELVDLNRMRSKKMNIPFTKMIACGNDYIYIACTDPFTGRLVPEEQTLPCPESLALILADRHRGAGSDGLVIISAPHKNNAPDINAAAEPADARMSIFNHDGTPGVVGGNAIRCVAKYLFDSGIVPKKIMSIETPGGVKTLSVATRGGTAHRVAVDMGIVDCAAANIPAAIPGVTGSDMVIGKEITVGGKQYTVTCLSVGNPHCVIFCPDCDDVALAEIGPLFEHSPLFPERINTEFVTVYDENTLRVRVWERGNGETLSCGTGACAAAAAAVLEGRCLSDSPLRVILDGGDLTVTCTKGGDGTISTELAGVCETVFTGSISV